MLQDLDTAAECQEISSDKQFDNHSFIESDDRSSEGNGAEPDDGQDF